MEEFNIVVYLNDGLFIVKEVKIESEIFLDLFLIEIIDEFFIFVSFKIDFFFKLGREYIDLEVFYKSEIVSV